MENQNNGQHPNVTAFYSQLRELEQSLITHIKGEMLRLDREIGIEELQMSNYINNGFYEYVRGINNLSEFIVEFNDIDTKEIDAALSDGEVNISDLIAVYDDLLNIKD